jgi:hypothetical protein
MRCVRTFFEGCELLGRALRAHAVPVAIRLLEAKTGVERTRGGVVALNLQRGIAGTHLLRPGEDLGEQRGGIALLAVLRTCDDIHDTERLGIDNRDGAGDCLIAIPQRGEDAWSRNGLQDCCVGLLLIKRLAAQLAVERQLEDRKRMSGLARSSYDLS